MATAVSEEYVYYGRDDNWGCRWDDPELGIPWPAGEAVLSERNAAFGSLADLRTVLGPKLTFSGETGA